jgi:hypothetical protein
MGEHALVLKMKTISPVRFQYERQARLLVHGIPLASATYGGGPP